MEEKNEFFQKQYDRFILQLREEVRELYWLHNFFLVVDIGLFAMLFKKDFINEQWASLIPAIGMVISLLWFLVTYKQHLWRNDWIERIKQIDKHLHNKYPMFKEPKKKKGWRRALMIFLEFLFKQGKISLIFLSAPLSAFALWFYFLTFSWRLSILTTIGIAIIYFCSHRYFYGREEKRDEVN